MSLLFSMLSRLVITFLPRSKCLLISWLHSPSAVILEPQKIKSDTVSHELMGPDAMILVFWMLRFFFFEPKWGTSPSAPRRLHLPIPTEPSFIKLFHALSGGGPWGLEFVSSLCCSSTGWASLVSSQLLSIAGLQEQMLKGPPFIYVLLPQS